MNVEARALKPTQQVSVPDSSLQKRRAVMSDIMEMKVSNKKGTGFYIRAAGSFLKGVPAQEAKDDKPALEAMDPVDALKISGLGEAINTAVATAAAVTKDGLATIKSIETQYPDMTSGRGCAQIVINLDRVK